MTDKPVPPEFMVIGPEGETDEARAAYSAAWRAHEPAVRNSGMTFDTTMPENFLRDDDRYAFSVNGGPWTRGALPPRRESA